MVKDIHEIKECPDCASMDILYNERRQQVICRACGLIYEPLTPREEETYLGYLGLAKKTTPKKVKRKAKKKARPKRRKAAAKKKAKKKAPKKKAAKKKRKPKRRR